MTSVDMPGPALGLSRIVALLHHLEDPHLVTPIIHVAGTNGKGSICAYIDSIFRNAGYRTGRFNSPHLVEPRDSVLLHGEAVSSASFSQASELVDRTDARHGVGASPFERLTATAFQLFANAKPKLDLAVVEVGLGGELDATNVCPEPLATVLAPVDLDHQALLGNTVEEIAHVKCGIFKPGRPCIVAAQKHSSVVDVAFRRAEAISSPCYLAQTGTWHDDQVELPLFPARSSPRAPALASSHSTTAHLPLAGSYQATNASAALLAAHVVSSLAPSLAIRDRQAFLTGLESTSWPARLSWVPLPERSHVLADGAHNPSAAAVLRSHLDSLSAERLTTLIVALSSPREPMTILEPLLRDWKGGRVRVIATGFSTPVEGMPWVTPVEPERIARTARGLGVQDVETRSTVAEALELCGAKEEDELVVVAGSLYLVADLYRMQR